MLIIENMSSAKRKMKQKKNTTHDYSTWKQKLLYFDLLLCSLFFSALFYVVKGNLYTYSGCLLVAYYPKLHCDKQTHEAFPVFWVISSSIQR